MQLWIVCRSSSGVPHSVWASKIIENFTAVPPLGSRRTHGGPAAWKDSGMITFRLPDGVDHRFGDGGDDTVVELSDEAWDDFRHERRTAFGLLYAGMIQLTKGSFESFADWEVDLRRQWEGRPVYDD